MIRTVTLSRVRERSWRGGSLASARVGHCTVWLHSHDAPLRASVEGFCGPAWLTSAALGRRLRAPLAVDPAWRRNIQELHGWWEKWWGYAAPQPEGLQLADAALPRTTPVRTGLFFSGGVDSFYSLLFGPIRPDALVYVQGFDVPLGDRGRLNAITAVMRSVAAELGIEALILSANLRRHSSLRRVTWERMHGAALAAAGHALGARLGQLLISSSLPPGLTAAWGSHWQTDHLWSSAAVQFTQVGSDRTRREKAWAIAAHPLAQRYLRVCWQNRPQRMNCSECDKCVCTMTLLELCGWLPAFGVFDPPDALPALIDRVRRTAFVHTYAELLQQPIEPRLRTAIEGVLRRTLAMNESCAYG